MPVFQLRDRLAQQLQEEETPNLVHQLHALGQDARHWARQAHHLAEHAELAEMMHHRGFREPADGWRLDQAARDGYAAQLYEYLDPPVLL